MNEVQNGFAFTGRDYCNPTERCGKCKYCLSLIDSHEKGLSNGAITAPDIEELLTRTDLEKALVDRITEDELNDLIGAIKEKSESDVVEGVKAVHHVLMQRFAGFATKDELEALRDTIAAMSLAGDGPDLEQTLSFVNRLKAELQAEFAVQMNDLHRMVDQKIQDHADQMKAALDAWSSKIDDRFETLNVTLSNLSISVKAEMPAPIIKPEITIPDEAIKVNVTNKTVLEESDKISEKEIFYSRESGRPERIREKLTRIPK